MNNFYKVVLGSDGTYSKVLEMICLLDGIFCGFNLTVLFEFPVKLHS